MPVLQYVKADTAGYKTTFFAVLYRFDGVESLSCCFLLFAHKFGFNFLKGALLSCIQMTSDVGWCEFAGRAAS